MLICCVAVAEDFKKNKYSICIEYYGNLIDSCCREYQRSIFPKWSFHDIYHNQRLRVFSLEAPSFQSCHKIHAKNPGRSDMLH